MGSGFWITEKSFSGRLIHVSRASVLLTHYQRGAFLLLEYSRLTSVQIVFNRFGNPGFVVLVL